MRVSVRPQLTIQKALLGHFRRRPIQAVFLLVGITIATVLLVATQLINAQAQASYARGDLLMNQKPMGYVMGAQGQRHFAMQDYIALRRAGFDQLVPVLNHSFQVQPEGNLPVIGLDWLAFNNATPAKKSHQADQQSVTQAVAQIPLEQFILPPYRMLMAPKRIQQLGVTTDKPLRQADGKALPEIVAAPDNSGLGYRTVADLQALQQLAGLDGLLSAIWVMPMSEQKLAALKQVLPAHLSYRPAVSAIEKAALANSLHLNLAAMGLLSFVVGIFLAFNAIQFSYTDRKPLLRRLRLNGVSIRQLRQALMLELLIFVIIGSVAGYLLGIWLAGLLLPGVGQTLAQLYGIYIDYPNQMMTTLPWLPLVMISIAAVVAAVWPMQQVLNQSLLMRYHQQQEQCQYRIRDRLLLLASAALLVTAYACKLAATNLWIALFCLACTLLSGAFALPSVLRLSLNSLQRLIPAHRPLLQWLLADSRWLLGPAAVSLMAMTMVLVANSGLNTMIGSFRSATLNWLDQRLVAPIYLNVTDGKKVLSEWMQERAPQVVIAERHSIFHPEQRGLSLASLPPLEAYYQSIELISEQPQARQRFAQGQGIYISERFLRLDDGQLGQQVRLCEQVPAIEVVGVYYDYGNPHSQWMLDEKLFHQCWPKHVANSTALLLSQPNSENQPSEDWSILVADLSQAGLIRDEQVIDQQQVKQMVMTIFNQTFTITEALNSLTLLVAAIGIFCATSAIHHHRSRQQAQLASLGVTKQQRLWMMLGQWTILALLSMLIVWPFGTLLAWILASVVTPAAFGWSFETLLIWHHYPVLAALALICVLLATALPTLKLRSANIASLLKEVDE